MDLKKYTPEIINTLQKLIRIKTVLDTPVEGGPFGQGNKECLEETLKVCESLGFKVKNLDGYCGYAEVGEGEELVGIIGHLDVVPEGEGWKYPAYCGDIIDGELWGRGAWDDKGPTVISIYAIKALMDSGFNFNKRVRLIFGCNEESGSLCMEHYLKVDEPISYGVSPDANFPVIFAEKTINNIKIEGKANQKGNIKLNYLDAGIVINAVPDKCVFEITYACDNCKNEAIKKLDAYYKANNIKYSYVEEDNKLVYTVLGKAAHGSIPHTGVNAASFAICGLNEVVDNSFVKFYANCIGTCVHGEKLGCYAEDEYGPVAVNIGLVHYENDEFSIKINSRLPFNTTSEIMIKQIKETIKDYDVNATLLSSASGFKMDPESTMIKALVAAYQEVTHDYESKPICCAGGTYAREFNNCVAFGPEMEGYGEVIIHQPNERIQIRAIEDIMKIYYKAYADLIEKVSFK